jgi:hypothetical protein
MRLRLFDRLWRIIHARGGSRDAGSDAKRASRAGWHRKGARPPGQAPAPRSPAASPAPDGAQGSPHDYAAVSRAGGAAAAGRTRGGGTGGGGTGAGAVAAGSGRARIREAPFGSAPVESLAREARAREAQAAVQGLPPVPRQPWYQVVPPAATQARVQGRPPARSRANGANGTATALTHQGPRGAAARQADLPFAAPHPEGVRNGDGRTNCGPIERILWRQWDEAQPPPPQAIAAVERLASFPRELQDKLANGLDGIYIGAGGVPELDHMTELRGVPLPSGRATWDACAGAYGERKIVVGTRPSPTPDVMCHEVGHALDDLDSPPGTWQSDSSAFRLIYDECQPYIASDFHRQRGGLGRKEFFADAFAAIASGQRPALVDMLNGNTRCALKVMLYFNRRYGI